MLSYGCITSNVLGLALTDHPNDAGAASALIGSGGFAFSAVIAPLVGVGGNGTARRCRSCSACARFPGQWR
jgi:MFS transporter, DHA1 family, multidrug resistance protein